MDYETFGEHQWESTGIFQFLEHFPAEIFKHPHWKFATPSEVVQDCAPVAELPFHRITSWADMERDITAWRGNRMQTKALNTIYDLKDLVVRHGNSKVLDTWRKLQTSDHFYYMCTKYFADGDVHKYFNPYESPYDSYINFMNVLDHLRTRMSSGTPA